MRWLQNYDKFNDLAYFDPETGAYVINYRNELRESSPENINGFFLFLEGEFVAIYSLKGELRVFGKETTTILNGKNNAFYERNGNYCFLSIKREGKCLLNIKEKATSSLRTTPRLSWKKKASILDC